MSRWWNDWPSKIFGVFLVLLLVAIFVWVIWLTIPPSEGYVRDKKHTAEYTHWHDGGQTCFGEGTSKTCFDNPDTPHQHCVGGCWELFLSHCKIKNGKQKCKKGWISVTKEIYDKYGIGDYYPSPK